ncbi:mono/diheme cytochrome c family protein [Rhizobium binae]|uniref:Mono/diheme cytochrome c family protein n=1 Tax=Rhizobium binae TaxID=1138190 RepID=A0ABV2MPQ7_9HYPH|nr:cytochrome c [Rhizobium binae]MBX4970036.1 cytochrome c [Rhizobium binae]MBX4994919.1 cytochrome c [Rhizobium binae]NKL52541.1 cytochrome c [Rhizobium leguminosarum bv. viciae]QSY85006.1 cytochrome c [Rhizobium binae]
MTKLFLGLAAVLLLPACDDMDHQPRYDSYERSGLFADGQAMQAPPDGAVARDDESDREELETRPPMSLALLARGHERYEIYCTPCHDPAGYGNGRVPSRGFPHPPSFHMARLRDAPDHYIVDVITNGHGVMYSYADRVLPRDRWAIAAYVKALQLSQNAPPAALAGLQAEKKDAQP